MVVLKIDDKTILSHNQLWQCGKFIFALKTCILNVVHKLKKLYIILNREMETSNDMQQHHWFEISLIKLLILNLPGPTSLKWF